MTVKRALVVDDSKSARAFLARILERHDLVVDNAESAEEAIDYLRQQRPDVIFMDHLMPGMDGFQAVQAIKNDPRTAMIPILMYTSQEGELYLSQARALGALGVLPKQTKPADVTKALFQLRLLPERRSQDSSSTTIIASPPLDPEPVTSTPATPDRQELRALPADVRVLVESLLQEHSVELRRFVVENLESSADRIVGDMRLMLHDGKPATAPDAPAAGSSRLALALGALATALIITFGVLWYRAFTQRQQLQQQLVSVQGELQQADARVQSLTAAAAAAASVPLAVTPSTPAEAATPVARVIEPVPFGEAPLSGLRVERVQALLERLIAQNFQGVVQLRSFPGRFCLAAGGEAAPVPASAATLYAQCSSVGNPQETATTAQRESVAFANMLAAQRVRSGSAIEVQILAGSAEDVQQPYPAIDDMLTAGEWNRAAAANNRLEVRWSARR